MARVDGVEITRRELIFEIESDPALRGLDGASAQRAALDALVARKLLSAAATRALLDRSPDFIAARRRMNEIMLADSFADRLAAELQPISEAEVERFMTANPAMFAQRQMLNVTQLVVPSAWTAGLDGAVETADRVRLEMRCQREPGKCVRQSAIIDTLSLEPSQAQIMAQLPVGASHIVTQQPALATASTEIETVVSRHAVDGRSQDGSARARSILRWRQIRQARAAVLVHLRSKSAVSYQTGFKP